MQQLREEVLTHAQALERSAAVQTHVKYSLLFNLGLAGDAYQVASRVEFLLQPDWKSHQQGLFIEFNGKGFSQARVNGQDLASSRVQELWKDNKLFLPADLLKPDAANVLEFLVSNRFNNDQFGFIRAQDPDGDEYSFIQTVPYYASRITPLFDQPDLKGEFKISVVHSRSDICITTGPLVAKLSPKDLPAVAALDAWVAQRLGQLESAGEESQVSFFEPTPLLSTYLLNLVCGPLHELQASEEQTYRDIKMHIYCRKSMSKYAESEKDNIFEFQKYGLEFYESFFRYPYPFKKLDSIFCPEFAWSAMEYPGAVTYSENLLPQRKNNTLDIHKRGHVFLHEISHMWFGNLVTMKWWNNLWLNESFAEFICHQAFHAIQHKLSFRVSIPWVGFQSNKFRGYREDQLESTHPIAGEVLDTQVASSIFDGITYNKGSSVLRQLMAIIGEDSFSNALEKYFHKHAFKNTDLEDLLSEFDTELKKNPENRIDIFEWKQDWINQAGLNQLEVTQDESTKEFFLRQTACRTQHCTIRNHFINIGFYDSEGQLVSKSALTTSKSGSDKIAVPEGVAGILPNEDDLSFVKVILDPSSAGFFLENFTSIENPLSRILILRSFYDMVLTSRVSLEEYLQLVKVIFEKEHEDTIYNTNYDLINNFLDNQADEEESLQITEALFAQFYQKSLVSLTATSIECMLKYGHSKLHFDTLLNYYRSSPARFSNHQLYSLIEMYLGSHFGSAFDAELYGGLLEDISQRDKTDSLGYKLSVFEVMKTDPAQRIELLKKYMKNENCSFSATQVEAFATGMTSRHIPLDIRRQYYPVFFAWLPLTFKSNTNMYIRKVLNYLTPTKDMKLFVAAEMKKVYDGLGEKDVYIKDLIQKLNVF